MMMMKTKNCSKVLLRFEITWEINSIDHWVAINTFIRNGDPAHSELKTDNIDCWYLLKRQGESNVWVYALFDGWWGPVEWMPSSGKSGDCARSGSERETFEWILDSIRQWQQQQATTITTIKELMKFFSLTTGLVPCSESHVESNSLQVDTSQIELNPKSRDSGLSNNSSNTQQQQQNWSAEFFQLQVWYLRFERHVESNSLQVDTKTDGTDF